jgi:hypothetical protein
MADREAGEYLDWRAPDKPVAVRLSRALIPQINVEVMRGFGATRRRGTEIGGILLGRRAGGATPVMVIDGFETVPCEYAFGPSYLLSAADAARFSEAVQRHAGNAVGFFRSHTRDGLSLDAADAELVARHFAGSPNAALLIKPFASRTGLASFFVSSGGPLEIDARPVEFDFAPNAQAPVAGRTAAAMPGTVAARPASAGSQMAPGAPEPEVRSTPTVRSPVAQQEPVLPVGAVSAVPEPSVREVLPPEPAPPAPAPAPSERNSPENPPSRTPGPQDRLLSGVLGVRDQAPWHRPRNAQEKPLFDDYAERTSVPWKRWAAALAFTLAAILFGAVAGYQYGVNSESPLRDPYDLGMFVRAADESIAVHWNQFAFPVRRAVSAVLTIREAESSNRVELTIPELRNGEMLYRPAATRADIRLELAMPDGRTLSQTVSWRR